MEIATVHLKLSGDPQNTIFKHNVTPAELAVYAHMHGDDCVQSISDLRNVELDRDDVMEKLHEVFRTDNAVASLKSLFPGFSAELPKTFRSIGFHVDDHQEEPSVLRHAPTQRSAMKSQEAANVIQQRIQMAQAARNEGQDPLPHTVASVDAGSMENIFSAAPQGGQVISDDPLDLELAQLGNQ